MDTKFKRDALSETTSDSDSDENDIWYQPRMKRRSTRKRVSVNLFQSEPVRRSSRAKTMREPKNTDEEEDFEKLPDYEAEAKSNEQERGYEADGKTGTIIGATELTGELSYLFKWNDGSIELVASKEANVKYPYEVIDYFESCMVWNDSEDDADLNMSLPVDDVGLKVDLPV